MKRTLFFLGSALLLSGTAFTQGSDSCATAQAIAGLGPHNFDNAGATTDGPADCGGKAAHDDVWFLWTAPLSGGYFIDTCGTATKPVRIVIYDSTSCPVGSKLACKANGCLFDTRFSFPTNAGQTYLIRIGSKTNGETSSGTFQFNFDKCWTLSDDGFEDNDTCQTAASVAGNGTYMDLFVSKTDPDWYEFDVEDGNTLQVDVQFSHSEGDLDIYLFDACGGTALVVGGSADDNETVMWLNDTGSCVKILLRVEHWGPDTAADCNTYDMVVSGSSPQGTCGVDCPTTTFCDEGQNPNNVTDISIESCNLSASPNNVCVTNGGDSSLDGQFAYLLLGDGNATVSQPPGAKGDLCVLGGSCLGRYTKDVGVIPMCTDISNSLSAGPNYGIPTCGGNILVGETWFFQYWHRQPMGAPASFSSAIEVTFAN